MAKAEAIIVGIFLAVAVFVGGVLIGRLTDVNIDHKPDETIKQKLLNEISLKEIDKHLRALTNQPHLSGTAGDEHVVEYIQSHWKKLNFDSVETVPYKVLLSSPDRNNPNVVTVRAEDGRVLESSKPFEPILVPQQNDSRIIPPFNAYSPPGVVKGNLVYINYGRVSDFELAVKRKIPINGSICLVRYGFNFRADKVSLGEKHGCIGMIMYTDPADYAIDKDTKVYPDSWDMPEGGVQRGTIKESSGGLGDPLTPLYPSTDSAFRLNISDSKLPGIPCHAIGYGDAEKLLRHMTGEEVPQDWRGGINVTYRFGPILASPATYVNLSVSTNFSMGTIKNIFGVIKGSVEPDRYILIGNHHDAWVFGGVDPSSGTAVMLELSRAFSRTIEQGWRPYRTIIFCAWGGEEQGIIGSREWVEEFGKILNFRAVAYLNVDSAIQGRYVMWGRGLPLLNTVMFNAAKSVPNPDEEEVKRGRKTVYDTWVHRAPDPTSDNKPRVSLIGSGSDFSAFVSSLGVSSVDLRFSYDKRLNISSFPLYHTGYETYHLYTTYHDPGFLYSRALAQVWGEMARQLSDSLVLPLDVGEFLTALQTSMDTFRKKYQDAMMDHNITLTHLLSSMGNFTEAVLGFQERLESIDIKNVLLVRQYNEQLMHLERSFIDFAGLPGRPAIRNVLYAPSRFNSYSATVFPGVIDAWHELVSETMDPRRKERLVDEVKKQISILSFFIQSAASMLKDPTDFMRS